MPASKAKTKKQQADKWKFTSLVDKQKHRKVIFNWTGSLNKEKANIINIKHTEKTEQHGIEV